MRESTLYQEWQSESESRGELRGRQVGERSLVLRLLARRLGTVPSPTLAQINALPLEQLEALGEALLDFTVLNDLLGWLEQQR